MSKKLYTVRMGVMRTFDVVRKTNKGWYVTGKGISDVYIARNNKTVRVAANKGDLSYYEYNHVTANRGEAKAVCDEQITRYARYCRIEMMEKLNRPIIDVVEITNVIEGNGGVSVSVYHNGNNGICVTSHKFGCYEKQGFEVRYAGDALKFEADLSLRLNEMIEVFKNG